MIVKEEFLSNLRRAFDLNLYEVRIWTALLSRGISTAGELSDIGNVPRSRAYDVLESLEKKGFVVMKLGKPIKYIAVEPKEVVERAKKLVRMGADDNLKKLDGLKGTAILKELDSLHKTGIEFIDASDLSGAIRGRHNLYTHLETMIKRAEKNVTIMTTAKGLVRKVDALKPELERLAKKGVKIRIAAPVTKESVSAVKDLSKIAEIRNINKINARFCVVDDNEMMFMVKDDEDVHPTYDIGVWVNTQFFANALGNMFNLAWKDMQQAEKVKV
ncbi:MAG: helix-turn-helix domain-containing protein [Candidatus Nanoarchaeia archaeon]|jgi:sugar-specific transcriptional regulator TrmB|nr:helix-turn-helix domain-containing protein [Candidatus Nanoarchaeia archaeon]|tara:strand:+ start:27312 stop:28130 length:819 start_codon:yes stop_codon:yes gene_type:complete